LAFTKGVLIAADEAARSALSGRLTVLIIKQLKGAGVHARGAKSHNLYAMHTLDNPDIINALKARALTPTAWELVRTNFERSGGGPPGVLL
jgi:phosphoketolase